MKSCKLLRHENLMPGWGCCECKTYNSDKRNICKFCNHFKCGEAKAVKKICNSCGLKESTGIIFDLCDGCFELLVAEIKENQAKKKRN